MRHVRELQGVVLTKVQSGAFPTRVPHNMLGARSHRNYCSEWPEAVVCCAVALLLSDSSVTTTAMRLRLVGFAAVMCSADAWSASKVLRSLQGDDYLGADKMVCPNGYE
jgi:hypothetical protein